MSSSTFSSENLRAYSRRPPAERRYHVLVAALLVVVLPVGHWFADGVEEALLPHSGLAPLVLARQALSESTEVVVVGSSHVLLGVWPELLPVEAMNITGPGWDYRSLEAAVLANLERTPNLRLAVIELDTLSMRIDTSIVQRGRCGALRVWGISEEDVPCVDRPIDEGRFGLLSRVLIPSPRLTPEAIWETVKPRFVGSAESRVAIAGHRTVLFAATREQSAKHGRERVRWLQKRFGSRFVRDNQAALGRLTDLLQQHGVRVVLLRMPHQESFTSHVPQAWVRQIERAARRLRGNDGVRIPVWNYERGRGFVQGDFMDSVHLNSIGAKKLSRRLGTRIRRELERHPELERR